jgi:hypothetical protein
MATHPVEHAKPARMNDVHVLMVDDVKRLVADCRGTVITLRTGEVYVIHPSIVRLAYWQQQSPADSPSPEPPRGAPPAFAPTRQGWARVLDWMGR